MVEFWIGFITAGLLMWAFRAGELAAARLIEWGERLQDEICDGDHPMPRCGSQECWHGE